MNIILIDNSEIEKIKPLWEKLNAHHLEKSSYFKSHFESFTFEDRVELLSKAAHMVIIAAENNSELVGYCIASTDNETGEIDSLFVKEEYRGKGTGHKLMQKAMVWLEGFKCKAINIGVAAGNEEVLPFYEKYGFRERVRVLQKDVIFPSPQ